MLQRLTKRFPSCLRLPNCQSSFMKRPVAHVRSFREIPDTTIQTETEQLLCRNMDKLSRKMDLLSMQLDFVVTTQRDLYKTNIDTLKHVNKHQKDWVDICNEYQKVYLNYSKEWVYLHTKTIVICNALFTALVIPGFALGIVFIADKSRSTNEKPVTILNDNNM